MDAAADDCRALEPPGFVGLCLSLIGLLAFGALITALAGGVAVVIAGLMIGWPALSEALHRTLTQGDSIEAVRTLFAGILVFYIALAGAVVLAAKWRGGQHWRDLIGWRSFRLSDRMLWAIIAAALIYSALANNMAAHFLTHPPVELAVPVDPVAAAALFVLAVLAAPVTEELVFRGWIYTGLRFHWGFWPALLTTSVLFAGAHYERTHVYALAVFPIGLALGVVRERTGSVRASILFHALNNFAAFALSAIFGS